MRWRFLWTNFDGAWVQQFTLAGVALADANSPIDPTNPTFWASFGILGLFLFCLFRRWLVPGYFYDQEVQRRKEAEALNDVLRKQVAEQTQAMNETVDLLSWLVERQEAIDRGNQPAPPPRRARPKRPST